MDLSMKWALKLMLLSAWMSFPLGAAVKSIHGKIEFKLNESTEMTLNETGLGIGKTPSVDLDVAGNVQVGSNLILSGGMVLSPFSVSGNILNIDPSVVRHN